MIDYTIINGRTVRTTFFILFVGGLYFLLSSLVTTFCNTVLFGWIHIPCITTLEGAGILGFLCVIYFGISFGLKHKNEKIFNKSEKTYSEINSGQLYYNNSNTNNKTNNTFKEFEEIDDLIKYKNAINEIKENTNTLQKKSKTKISDSKCLKTIEKMTKEQKLQLQLTLAKSCGIELESKINAKN